MSKILITGASGQIGSELVVALSDKYGNENVIASDIRKPENLKVAFEILNVLDKESMKNIVEKHKITTIYHLAALLSATGEKDPLLCWNLNMGGFFNVIEMAKEHGVRQIIHPSSIAVFGSDAPKENTPQNTALNPATMYGITKLAGEQIGEYYVRKFGLDIRGIRYPGLIGYNSPAGGGTTDYAVEIFHEAIKSKKYTCFLSKDTKLPMMYIKDAIRGTLDLAEADFKKLKNHCNFNFSGMTFSCQEIAAEIKKHIPEFEIEYKPDFRQKIADSWPNSIDDSAARKEWKWKPEYDLQKMVKDMITNLHFKYN
jgi:nucleoside-diphosphate-sugar epimerase